MLFVKQSTEMSMKIQGSRAETVTNAAFALHFKCICTCKHLHLHLHFLNLIFTFAFDFKTFAFFQMSF